MVRNLLFIILFLSYKHSCEAQDTLRIKSNMYRVLPSFPIIQDQNYDKFEAKNLIFKKNVVGYKDRGRIFRSYSNYWTGGILLNESSGPIPILLEGNFKEIWVDGKPISFCGYKECEDPDGIIKQPQLLSAYVEVGVGSHLFVAKLGDFHLKKKFNVAFSDRTHFEGNTFSNHGSYFYILAFFSGIFFVLMLLSILMYFLIKDKSFFYYSIFCFSLWIHVNRTLGENFEYFYFIDDLLPWLYWKYIWFSILFISYFLFGTSYIKEYKNYAEIDKLISKYIKVLLLCLVPELIFLSLGFYEISYTYYFIVRYVSGLFGIYILFLLYKERENVFVKFVIVGGSLLLSSELITSTFQNQVSRIIGLLGLLFEIIVFSAALAYKVYYEYYHVVVLEKENANKELTIEKLEKEKLKLSMSTLQAQLNPHFIFNSMNSIKEFIMSNQTNIASDYLTKFSVLMRKVLDYSSKESIILDEEILVTKQYIEFLQLMSSNQVTYEIQVQDDLESDLILVPPLLLQPYIENIFKHAFTKKTLNNRFIIKIFEEEFKLIIEITDNGIGMHTSNHDRRIHTPKGMEITKSRIKTWGIFYNKKCNVTIFDIRKDNIQNGTRVKIEI